MHAYRQEDSNEKGMRRVRLRSDNTTADSCDLFSFGKTEDVKVAFKNLRSKNIFFK